jgi:glyceraldehyde 3-phosphate dehydrogenase
MLKYDTVHGQFKGTVELSKDKKDLIINGRTVKVFGAKDPATIKWGT